MGKEKVKKPFYKKWWVWVIAIIVVAAATGGEEDTGTSTASSEPKSEVASTEPAKKEEKKSEKKSEEKKPKQFTVGQEVKVGNLSYIVKGVTETNKISSVLGDKTTEGKFAIVELTVKNNDKKARMADTTMFKIKTADDTEYDPDVELDMYANEAGETFFLQDINPNLSKTGKVVFELPAEAKEYNLEVSSGAGWSGGEYEQIKLK
ncbi:DUF4352 domain-containing protein [Fictibacillus sp. JL2B1089]|uniref:DUF4352 domain-containing protein n=1 Tax=Fictibacillus sp. JL2B1089 TaxID=3399565 RepID=UPI003A883729